MADPTKGLGVCLIPTEDDGTCGRQIEEGEPIGTVVLPGGPIVGHKRCADGFHQRRQAQEREKRMKIGKQQGPGGSIGDPSTYPDALAFGSKPLVPEGKEIPPTGVTSSPIVDPTVLATVEKDLTWDRKMAAINEAEQAALDAVKARYAEARQEASDQPKTYNLTLDLTEVPPDVDILVIELDLRKLRP